jgi:hypothetical protein
MAATKPPQTKVGRKFGMLTPHTGFYAKNSRGKNKLYYKCDCDCGTKDHVVISCNLRNAAGSNSCGCKQHTGNRAQDITGQKFGMLTALKPTEKRYRKSIVWLFKCDCGIEKEISAGEVVNLKTASCGCKRRNPDRDEQLWKREMLRALRLSEEYGSTPNIDLETYKHLSVQDCFYCGKKPEKVLQDKKAGIKYLKHGLDRVDPKQGYLKSNVVTCCEKCNRSKLKLSYYDWVNLISRVYHHFVESGKFIEYVSPNYKKYEKSFIFPTTKYTSD